jgi:energy-converting hydrogenase Eha subunit A
MAPSAPIVKSSRPERRAIEVSDRILPEPSKTSVIAVVSYVFLACNCCPLIAAFAAVFAAIFSASPAISSSVP